MSGMNLEVRGIGLTRRGLLRATAGAGALAVLGPGVAAADGPIVKPLPLELFDVFGSNAEMRWEAMAGQGFHTPIDRFFVRNHTATVKLDANTWRLRVFGTGLRGGPVEFDYATL